MKDISGTQSLEEKLSRIRKLSQIQFPSDQEIEERTRLYEEVALMTEEINHNNTCTDPQHAHGNTTWAVNAIRQIGNKFTEKEVKLGEGKGFVISTKKQKKSLLDILIVKLKKKPATWDEIQQLKLEKMKESLKADIKIAKWKQRNPGGKSKSSNKSSNMKFFDSSESKSRAKDFKDMTGSNDSKKYKGLIP